MVIDSRTGPAVAASGDPAERMLSLVGHRHRAADRYVVDREKIREYARAVQDHHPVHWSEEAGTEFGYDGLIAPPTFFSVPGFLAQTEMFTTLLTDYDMSQIMQTDQVLEFHRPIRPRDHLAVDICLESFRRAFGGDLMGFKMVISDQYDDPVLTARTSIVGRCGAGTGNTELGPRILMHSFRTPDRPRRTRAAAVTGPTADLRAPAPAAPSGFARLFGTIAVGDELPPRTVQLTVGDLVNYAGVAGDPNPIHWSREAASSVDLESPVAHGMLTMGIGAGYVTSWLGDPGALREYAVRLTSPVHVRPGEPAAVEYTGKVKALDSAQRTATIALTALHGGRRIFGRATARVQLS